MIHKTDQLLINGTNQIYNGYIYNVDYQPSFGQNPSYCTINLISEDGNYSITSGDLQVITPDTIQLGTGIVLNMYPVEFYKPQSSQGKYLEIKYVDTSNILDKKIVVLNGRQGNDGTANLPINPLPATSGSGNASSLVYKNDKFIGSCYLPVGKELLKLGETPWQVLDVVYTFPDLCDAIDANGIVIAQDSLNLIANSSQYYATSYIGSLRNVLAQWCTDLGYGFYWENNQLHFIDLRTPLILDTSQYDSLLQQSMSERVSIEDTVGRVACAFYGQDYHQDTVPFSQDTSLSFRVVSLFNVGYTQDQINSVTAAYYGEDFFFGYHFLINNTYAANVIGLNPGGNTSIALSSDQISNVDDDLNDQGDFSQYWFAQFNKADLLQSNYQIFLKLSQQVGKYYYVAMTYGYYKQISNSQYDIQFYPSNIQAGQTSLGELAANLGAGDERLDQFLLGKPYVPPNPNDPMGNSNLGNDATSTNPSQIRSLTPYDNQAGFCILTLPNQSWYLNGIPIKQSDIQAQMVADGTNTIIPRIRISDNGTIRDLFDDAPQAGFSITGPYQWDLVCAVTFPGYGALPLGVVSPEIKNPDILNHLTLNQPYSVSVPKIEEFFRSETDLEGNTVDCQSNVIKNEINFRTISNSDLTAIGIPNGNRLVSNRFGIRLVYPAAPNPTNLDEAFKLFTQNLTFSKIDPTIVRTYSLPYIDFPTNEPISLGKGLISLSIRVDENGINSTYTLGTRLMQIPSVEVIRANISFQNKTNESRYVPYGFNSFQNEI